MEIIRQPYSEKLLLPFAVNKSLTPKVGPTPTFTRSTTATYFDAQGVIQTAAIDAPRFDHRFESGAWASKGLLVEEARTNIMPYGTTIDANWTNYGGATITPGQSFPDGTTSAVLIEDTNGAAYQGVFVGLAVPAGNYQASFFIKKGSSDSFAMWMLGGTTIQTGTGDFDWVDGEPIPADAAWRVQRVADDWFRVSRPFTASGASITSYLLPTKTTTGLTGSTYFHGMQIEAGGFVTSWIPTTAAAVARGADTCTVSGLTPASEGTFYVSGEGDQPAGPSVAWLSGQNNNMALVYNSAGAVQTDNLSGYDNATVNSFSSPNKAAAFRAANAFGGGQRRGASAGVLGAQVADNAAWAALNELRLGHTLFGYGVGRKWYRDVRYYDSRLADSALEELTA